MNLELQGKRALVTGASSWLGRAVAQSLSEEGCRLFITGRTPEKVDDTVRQLSQRGGVEGCAGDLRSATDIENILRGAAEFLETVDIVVLSTGHPPTFPLTDASLERWNTGFQLLLQPAIEITKALAPKMAAQGYGRFLYIGSIFGLQPEASSIIQSTFRTGLNAFMKCVATEYAAHGVTANVICPGYIETPLLRELATQYAQRNGQSMEEVLDAWKNYAPSRKFGKAADLGALVSFLASPRGEFISGTAITIDGGAISQY
jgi:3-oxoacyl-[acyl-carrier protein] reductase